MAVRVQPGASRDSVSLIDGTIRVRIAAPPVEGKANRRLVEVLSAALGVRRSQLEIMKGAASRVKIIRIHDAGAGDIQRRLERFRQQEPGG